MVSKSEITARINDLVRLIGMPAHAIEKAAGLANGQLYKYLSGVCTPKSENAVKLASVLNCEPSYLLGF